MRYPREKCRLGHNRRLALSPTTETRGRNERLITARNVIRRPYRHREALRSGTPSVYLQFERASSLRKRIAPPYHAQCGRPRDALRQEFQKIGWLASVPQNFLKLCGQFRPAIRKLIFLRASRRLARHAIIREESQMGLKCPILSSRGLRSERVCENSL